MINLFKTFIKNIFIDLGFSKYFYFLQNKKYFSNCPFLSKKMIFVHIPKTAGNSVAYYFFKLKKGPGHFYINDYKNAILDHSNYYKFSVIRNPWDRVVSSFFYLKKGGRSANDILFKKIFLHNIESFDQFVNKLDRSFVFRFFVMKYTHFIPQYKFICSNEILDVDFVLRFESLEKDLNNLMINLNLEKTFELKHINRTDHKYYKNYYSSSTISIVKSLYEKDIQIFNYKF